MSKQSDPRAALVTRIGLPFKDLGRTSEGLDCWGLVVLSYKEDLGIDLPHFDTDYQDARQVKSISTIIERERIEWTEVPEGQEQPYDVILLREGALVVHVGLIVKTGQFIAAERNDGVCLQRYPSPSNPNRVFGIYRHPVMVARAHERIAATADIKREPAQA